MEFAKGNSYRNNNGDLFAILEECRNLKSEFQNLERAPEESEEQNFPRSKNDDDDGASDGLSTIMNSYLTTQASNQGMKPTENLLSTKNQGDLFALLEGATKIHFEKKRVSSEESTGSGIDVVQAADNRIEVELAICKEQGKVRSLANALLLLPNFGLKLDQEKSLKSLRKKLFSQNEPKLSHETPPPPPPPSCTKKNDKPFKSDVFMLRIGSWEVIGQNLEDVVAKCYFGKRQLVWEVLQNGLKKKIQMQWEHILTMRATIEKNQPEVLEIELGKPPSFFKEKNPEPKKHTIWEKFTDFTGGQASISRRHYLQFPQGTLHKYYAVLLRVPQFLQMSRRPFPALRSPHFPSDINDSVGRDVSVGCKRNLSHIIPDKQYDFPNSSTDFSFDRNWDTLQTNSVQQPRCSKDCQNKSRDIVSLDC